MVMFREKKKRKKPAMNSEYEKGKPDEIFQNDDSCAVQMLFIVVVVIAFAIFLLYLPSFALICCEQACVSSRWFRPESNWYV